MDIIETLTANEWSSREINDLIQMLYKLRDKVRNKELLVIFNATFGTTLTELSDVFERCDSVMGSRSPFDEDRLGFMFSGTRPDEWEIHFMVFYSAETGEFIDAIYESHRYYRWSYKDHGFDSLGDFQGKTLEEYAKDDQDTYDLIENDVTMCQNLVKQILK